MRLREVSGLIARYSLEQDIRDVYVEGQHDARVIASCLRSRGIVPSGVYIVQSVEIPRALVASADVPTEGNRGRCRALARHLADFSASVQVIIDRDNSDLVKEGPSSDGPAAIWTTQSSLETELLKHRALEMLVSSVDLGISTEQAAEIEQGVLERAGEFAALRTALQSLDAGPIKPISKAISGNLHPATIIERSLSSKGRLEDRDESFEKFQQFKELVIDPYKVARGHDVFEMLAGELRSACKKHPFLRSTDTLTDVLTTSCEKSLLLESPSIAQAVEFLTR